MITWVKRAGGLWVSTDGLWQIHRQTWSGRPTWYVYDSRPPRAKATFVGQATTLPEAKKHAAEMERTT